MSKTSESDVSTKIDKVLSEIDETASNEFYQHNIPYVWTGSPTDYVRVLVAERMLRVAKNDKSGKNTVRILILTVIVNNFQKLGYMRDPFAINKI